MIFEKEGEMLRKVAARLYNRVDCPNTIAEYGRAGVSVGHSECLNIGLVSRPLLCKQAGLGGRPLPQDTSPKNI